MTWTAPTIERRDPPANGDERALLDGFLEFHRETLLWKCSGLTGEQLASRPLPTSTMSLLGIVRHLTDVERHWFREVVAREDVRFLYWGNPDRDSDFDDLRAEDAEQDFLAFMEELEHSRAIQRTAELEAAVGDPADAEQHSYRWVMVHMIEEYARHNGHADLFRQAIDGETGE